MSALRAIMLLATLIFAMFVLTTCRLATCAGVQVGAATQVALYRLILRALGVRIRFEGALASQPALWVANHVSWIDVLALGSLQPLSFLAKREVGRWPLIGPLARWSGTVFVDRQRRRSILQANDAMARRIRARRSVVLFPEGTTLDGERLGPVRTSHLACLRALFAHDSARTEAHVQPVVLHYSDPAAAWLGDASLIPHVWSMLRRPGVTCAVVALEVIPVRPGFDRKALGRTLAARMGNACDAARMAPVCQSRRDVRHALRIESSCSDSPVAAPAPGALIL